MEKVVSGGKVFAVLPEEKDSCERCYFDRRPEECISGCSTREVIYKPHCKLVNGELIHIEA